MRICSYTVLLQIKNRGALILKGSIIDFILSVSLMLALYPFFKLNGLIMALVIATYVQAVYYLIKISDIYNVRLLELLPYKEILQRFVIVFFIVALIKYSDFSVSPFYNLLIGVLVSGVLAVFFIRKHYNLNSD